MIFIEFRLNLRRSLCFSVFISVLFYRESHFFLAYSAAVIHEFAHGAAAYMRGIKPKGIDFGVLGVRLDLPRVTGLKNKLFIYSAGPFMSFCLFACLFRAGKIFALTSGMYSFFTFANFVIGIVNLLPVFPLDGGIILRAVLGAYFGVISGAKKCRVVSDVLLVFLWIASLFLSICKVFNPSVAGILLFLIFNRGREKCFGITEKKAVLSGDVIPAKKLRYIACDAESELLCLAEYISYEYTLIVATFYKEKFFCDLNQDDIINGIKKYGGLCTVKDYVKLEMQKT